METINYQLSNCSTKILVRSYLLAILILTSSLSAWAKQQESIKKKEYNKTFSASQSDRLEVDNRFGNITITHWNKNEVAIRVEVEAKARTQERAQASIDRVQVEMSKQGNIISAITTLQQQNWNGGNNEHFSINYYINIPSKLTIDLTQKYGNINLPDNNNGVCNLHVKYGNINAGNFTANLEVNAQYGNVELGNVKEAYFDLSYCGNNSIKSGMRLDIDSKYSNLSLGDITKLNLESKYGNLKAQSLDKADLDIKYSEVTIDLMKTELIVSSLDYSTMTIRELSPNFRVVNAESRYGNLNIYIDPKASFNIIAENMKYGNYSIKGFNVTKQEVEDKNNYRSQINGGSNRRIEFYGNKYGNLNIKTR